MKIEGGVPPIEKIDPAYLAHNEKQPQQDRQKQSRENDESSPTFDEFLKKAQKNLYD